MAQLFCQSSCDWDEEKVNMFSKRDARTILSMRIPHSNSSDRVAWLHNKDAHYTVKSGYKMWQESNRQQRPHENSDGWKKNWKLQVPSN